MPGTATAQGLCLGLCCTSLLNLMLFKTHCQVRVKLPPHIRSVSAGTQEADCHTLLKKSCGWEAMQQNLQEL